MKKDYTDLMKIIIIVSLFFLTFILTACDGSWSIMGYEI
tara:strand:+ start:512 stop:628 length:117 start_codon:yes stop_codon:yes gene_type:complete